MSLLRSLSDGLRSLIRKERVSQELDEELNGFLEMAAEEKMKQGMSRKDAFRAVRLERGSLEEPTLGRTFVPKENEEGHNHVIVLSYALWRRRFDSDPEILGRMIRIEETPYTVIGVLPRNFDFSIP
jgi:hypothetical protein